MRGGWPFRRTRGGLRKRGMQRNAPECNVAAERLSGRCPAAARFGRPGSDRTLHVARNSAESRGVTRHCAQSRQTSPNVTFAAEWVDEVSRLRRDVLRFVTKCYV